MERCFRAAFLDFDLEGTARRFCEGDRSFLGGNALSDGGLLRSRDLDLRVFERLRSVFLLDRLRFRRVDLLLDVLRAITLPQS